MVKRTETVEHRLRMHMLAVIGAVGDAKTAAAGARVRSGDRAWLETKLQRMQAIAHEVLERIEQMEARREDH